MHIAKIQSSITAWAQFQPQDTCGSKAKDLFLKVHDGKLCFEKRAELPSCIEWFTAKNEYVFNENIKELREVLDEGYANRADLTSQEKIQLQELQTAHNELVERYERKNTPGIIGRILIFLGLMDYSEAVRQAVEAQKCAHMYEETFESDTDEFEGITGKAGSVGVVYHARSPDEDYVEVEVERKAPPQTREQVLQALQDLPAKIDAFHQARKAKNLPLHPDIGELRQEITSLQQALHDRTDGSVSEELLERHRHAEALFSAMQLE